MPRKGREVIEKLKKHQVKAANKCVGRICSDKTSWEKLECVVDNMQRVYRRIREVGFVEAMKEFKCEDLITGLSS